MNAGKCPKTVGPVSEKRAFPLAPAMGNILEFYDFALYAVMTPLLSPLFFPNTHEMLGQILSLVVVLIGFCARPIGALLFGHFGDRYGRKRGLMGSVALMACATLVMGLLPTFASVGWWAPLGLVLCRLCQGISTGGEGYGGVIYALEHHASNQHGWLSAWMSSAAIVGLLLATMVSGLVALQTPVGDLWRLPFLLGSLIGVFGVMVRRRLHETPLFLQDARQRPSDARAPWREVLGVGARRNLVIVLGISGMAGGLQLTLAGYVTLYLVGVQGMPFASAALLNAACLALYIPMLLLMGVLADRWSRPRLMHLGAWLTIVMALPIYVLLHSRAWPQIAVAQILLAILSAMWIAPKSAVLFRLFPTRMRYTGMSLGYTLGLSMLGGSMPLINHFMISLTNNTMAPAWILMVTAGVGLFSLSYVTDDDGNSSKKTP